jgi:glycyl-tRNA synthetase
MATRYDEVMSLSLRKGFIWPSVDIYGGFAGFYDYGHQGAAMKRKWENLWLKYFLGLSERYHLIDTTNILPFKSLKASGHVDHFTDILVSCSGCGTSHRGDHLVQDATGKSAEALSTEEIDNEIQQLGLKCPKCGGQLQPSTEFNMMFPMSIGPTGVDKAYLRPETAQGAFLNFKREFESLRRKIPFGLAIVGRAFRNEISPRQGTYRMREFIQAELQIFFNPKTFDDELDFKSVEDEVIRISFEDTKEEGQVDEVRAGDLIDRLPKFYVYHMAKIQQFYLDLLNLPRERFRFAELGEKERAFYNKIHFDIEIKLDSLQGWGEINGIHYRTDHDLGGHQAGSSERMTVNVEGEKVLPHVLELSFGVDRNIWAFLDLFYEKGERTVLKLPRKIAPIAVGVFPLVSKEGLPEMAREVYDSLKDDYDCFYDEAGSIGKRYARMDEVGTPFCLTVDYDSLDQKDVTIRERDTAQQKRVPLSELTKTLAELMKPGAGF